MVKRLVAELPRKQVSCAGSELLTLVLRKVFSPTLFPVYVAVAWNIVGETSNKMSGFALHQLGRLFIRRFFAHLGSPKVLVLDGWNEGRGKRGTLTLVKKTPASAKAAGHGEQMRAVLTIKKYQELQF